jgi:hypothetical protein
MSEITENDGLERLLWKTAAWCAMKSPFENLSDCLRTTELRPEIAAFPNSTELGMLVSGVQFVADKRAHLIDATLEQRPVGDLLVCEFNRSISSGESEETTQGFFDTEDRPPWDTWLLAFGVVLYGKEVDVLLVSWVPQQLFATVDRGISVNPYGCIYWLRSAPSVVLENPTVLKLRAINEAKRSET